MFVVTGATGNTGRVVAQHLLDQGAPVRVVGRHADRLGDLVARGAEPAVGDLADAEFLTRAFHGASGAYLVSPPDGTAEDFFGVADRNATGLVTAARAARLPFAVLLSSLGAEQPTGTGPIRSLHALEARLGNVTGLDVVFLRAGYFYENTFGALGLIRQAGINGGVIRPDRPVSMVATADIGQMAARALHDRTARGVSIMEAIGPRDYTLAEVTALLGAAIGRPDLPYVPFSDADFAGGLVGAGLSPAMAALYVEMSHGLNEGRVRSTLGRSAANSTPTSFEQFVPVLAGAYAAMG